MKLKLLISIILLTAVCASCASSRTGYRPPKRKKKDCNCSQWSLIPIHPIKALHTSWLA